MNTHFFMFRGLLDEEGEGGTGNGGGGNQTLFSQGQQGQQQQSNQSQQGQQGQQQQQQQQQNAFSWAGIIGEDGQFKQGWTESLPDNLKPAKDTLARYKSPEAMMLGLQSANQLLGAKSNAVIVPGENAKPEEIAAFRKALGVPDKPEGYGIKKPDNLPEGITWDDARYSKYSEVLHKHNATPALVKELLELQMQDTIAQHGNDGESYKKLLSDGIADLRKTFGEEFDAKMMAGAAILNHYKDRTGLGPDHPAMIYPEVAKFLAQIHQDFMTEHVRVDGKGIVGGDPGTTAKDIMTNKSNPLYEKYRSGDAQTVEHVRALLKAESEAKKIKG